jgi:DNA-binding response OmpR family regulator
MTLNIVVVEDYDALRQAVCSELANEGHHIIGLAMAEDIDDEIIGSVPDIYIIDLNLPGEDGMSLVQRIRASQPDAGLVIISARDAVVDRINGYSGGADVYLTKPISFDELKAVIDSLGHRLLSHRLRQPESPAIRMLSLKLVGPSQKTSLTQMEASLIAAFSRAPKRELEHWQVAEHLGAGSDINKQNVEVKLVRLRKKFAKCGFAGDSIVSLRGVGYRLCVPIQILNQ